MFLQNFGRFARTSCRNCAFNNISTTGIRKNYIILRTVPALKYIPDWFVALKFLKDLQNTVFFNGDTDVDNDDPDNNIFTFSNDVIGLANINFNNVNLDDEFDDDDLDTISLVKLIS